MHGVILDKMCAIEVLFIIIIIIYYCWCPQVLTKDLGRYECEIRARNSSGGGDQLQEQHHCGPRRLLPCLRHLQHHR